MSAPVELLDTKAFARAVGVQPETVRKWVRGGKLVPYGRTIGAQHPRFHPDQFAEAVGRGEPAAPAPTERAQDLEAYVQAMRRKAEATAPRSRRGA